MKVRYIYNVTCSGWCASLYPSLTLLPLPFCFQEHASDSLGRRLREEAEVNAALSQVSAFQLSCCLFIVRFEPICPCSSSLLPLFLPPQAKHAAEMQFLAQRAENKVHFQRARFPSILCVISRRCCRRSWPNTSSRRRKRACRSCSRCARLMKTLRFVLNVVAGSVDARKKPVWQQQ